MTGRQLLFAVGVILLFWGCGGDACRVKWEATPVDPERGIHEIRTIKGCLSGHAPALSKINEAADSVCPSDDYRYRRIYGHADGCGDFDGARVIVECGAGAEE